jgi:Flp pilus assembly protein TadB
VNGEIKQEKERSVEKTKDAGTVRESNKERSERKSAGRQLQQQAAVVGELSNSKSSSVSKSGVISVTSTSEGKREAFSGYVSVVVVVVVVVAVVVVAVVMALVVVASSLLLLFVFIVLVLIVVVMLVLER